MTKVNLGCPLQWSVYTLKHVSSQNCKNQLLTIVVLATWHANPISLLQLHVFSSEMHAAALGYKSHGTTTLSSYLGNHSYPNPPIPCNYTTYSYPHHTVSASLEDTFTVIFARTLETFSSMGTSKVGLGSIYKYR